MDVMDALNEIKKTKKYSSVHLPLLERICAEESAKYKKNKEIIKSVKNRLHVIYGAYFFENSLKKASAFIDGFDRMQDIFELSKNLAGLNVSSSERLEFICEFYKFIFDYIPAGDINSILDIGCGFNPFFLPFMYRSAPDLKLGNYYAFDIDLKLSGFINKYLTFLDLPQNAGCIDIISKIPEQAADMAFLFKIIPTVENCKKNRSLKILNEINVKYAAVSFPTKTLCGKSVGMVDNYAGFFEKNLDHNKFKIIKKHIFKNELVYALKNMI